jgi:hypothetical protein
MPLKKDLFPLCIVVTIVLIFTDIGIVVWYSYPNKLFIGFMLVTLLFIVATTYTYLIAARQVFSEKTEEE